MLTVVPSGPKKSMALLKFERVNPGHHQRLPC